MYCVIQTKGVDEPWWMMDDWKEMIVLEESCSTIEEAKKLYQELLEKYTAQYQKKREKKFSCAFWNENECEYCLQLYYGVLILTPEGKLYSEGE